ncbi:hypothetical protein VTO73DRAFT_7941 [Trametes versicolor]
MRAPKPHQSPQAGGGTACLVPTSNGVARRCPCAREPAVDEGAALRGAKATGTARLLVRSEATESAPRASQCADRSIRLVEYRRGVFVHRWDLRVCARGAPPSMACAERSTFSDGVDFANWRPSDASLSVAARERREVSVPACSGAGNPREVRSTWRLDGTSLRSRGQGSSSKVPVRVSSPSTRSFAGTTCRADGPVGRWGRCREEAVDVSGRPVRRCGQVRVSGEIWGVAATASGGPSSARTDE